MRWPEQGYLFKSKRAQKKEKLRNDLRAKYNDICQLCGKKIENERDVSIDHIIPKSKGGNWHFNNLQLAHKKCNQKKKIS